MKNPTEKQLKLIRFIDNYQKKHANEPPSYTEMAEYMQVSVPAIMQNLGASMRKGYIKKNNSFRILKPYDIN
jgi:hypothetical protein